MKLFNKYEYLFEELIKMGSSKQSAMWDVALFAQGNLGTGLSDDACSIITSPTYLALAKPTQADLNNTLNSLDNEAYSILRSWLFNKANSYAPDVKALHLHAAANGMNNIIDAVDPEYFK
jgi:hypothetical protein